MINSAKMTFLIWKKSLLFLPKALLKAYSIFGRQITVNIMHDAEQGLVAWQVGF